MDSFLALENNSINIIGIVKDYNENTREVAVYIPKFMPLIPEDRKTVSEMTNYGNNTLNSSIQYSSQIQKSSYIWAMAKNVDEKMPKVGSRVILTFMEANPDLLYWEPFNPNGDYEVIDSEKYDKIYSLAIGDKSADIMNDDTIKITLPNAFDCTLVHNKDKKELTFKILYSDNSSESIGRLFDLIGNVSYATYENGEYVQHPASGILRRIENIEKIIGNEAKITSFSKVSFNEGDIVPEGIYVLNNGNYEQAAVGSMCEASKQYYKAEVKDASGILEALTLVDDALGYPSNDDKKTDKSITNRVEDIESKIPTQPTEAGDYVLSCHVDVDGAVAYSWKKQ